MFSKNTRNNINKIYIRLLHNDVSIDINQLIEYISFLKKVKNILFLFDYNSFKYKYLDTLLENLNLYGMDYVIRCDDYMDLDNIIGLDNIIFNMTLKVPGDLCKVNYRSDDMDYMNLYFKLQGLNLGNVVNFHTDIYIDKDNVFKINETLLLLSKLGFSSNLYISDYIRSSNYNNSCLKSVVECFKPSIGYRLALDNITENKDLKINNISELDYVYSKLLKDEHMCGIDNDLTFLSIGEKFNVRLCNNIDGKECSTLSPFECLDLDGKPTEKFLECVRNDYKNMCCGCNCHQTYKERS